MIRWLALALALAMPPLAAQTVDQPAAVIAVGPAAVWIDTGNGDSAAKSIAVPPGGSATAPIVFGPGVQPPSDAAVAADEPGWTARLSADGRSITVTPPATFSAGSTVLRYSAPSAQLADQAIAFIGQP
jgi:hypothetical protein